MRSRVAGEVSNRIARAGPSCSSVWTRSPDAISPPSARSVAASASAIRCEPPRAIGQPAAWAAPPSMSANEDVSGASRGKKECAARPAMSARARSPRKGRRPEGSTARTPKRPSSSGWRGMRSIGPSASPSRSWNRWTRGPTTRRYAGASAPRPFAVSSTERTSTTALPPGKGCASGMSGWIHSSPRSARGSRAKKGEAAAIGWIAEQMSCRKPGSVNAALRVPPPMVGSASSMRTRRPARASSMAAESPFGPLPTTTASGMVGGYC